MAEGNPDSQRPAVRSIVTAHYTGKTINGKTFDSSRGGAPLACRLRDLIEGWIVAMEYMHIGDKWEVYTKSYVSKTWLSHSRHGEL